MNEPSPVITTAQIAAELRRLRWTVRALALLALAACTSALATSRPTRFDEIDVERINVRGADGRYAVVIANAERMPGNVIGGKERASGRRGSGLLFFNRAGDEAGGLIFDSSHPDSTFSAFGQLSVDRHESDQVAAIRYVESEQWEAGLQVSHYPREVLLEWHTLRDSILALPAPDQDAAMQALRRKFFREGKWEIPRLFAGERGKDAVLEIRDMRGRPRLQIGVDSIGEPRFVVIDSTGRRTQVLAGPR